MKTRKPTSLEIEELVSFLPRLYAEGFTPAVWHGGTPDQEGVIQIPWLDYNETVIEFIKVAERECWTDTEYIKKKPHQMLENECAVESADLNEIRTILTWCVRGERFCTGHWRAVIEGGVVRRLLQRLAELESNSI